MKLKEFLSTLEQLNELEFIENNENPVPQHFHITEVGMKSKAFIDCGGVSRREDKVYLQIWVADDIEHRLEPKKLIGIIEKFSFRPTDLELELEMEYQMKQTVGVFGLSFTNGMFSLESLQTDCLAKGFCLPPMKSESENKVNFRLKETKCEPNSGCC